MTLNSETIRNLGEKLAVSMPGVMPGVKAGCQLIGIVQGKEARPHVIAFHKMRTYKNLYRRASKPGGVAVELYAVPFSRLNESQN